MTKFPKVIYLHDGQDEVTWSEHQETEGVPYIKKSFLVAKRFEDWAKAAGFHDFEVNDNGCYMDDFLQHAYLGWEAAFIFSIASHNTA